MNVQKPLEDTVRLSENPKSSICEEMMRGLKERKMGPLDPR
jgi:hypothetical protein